MTRLPRLHPKKVQDGLYEYGEWWVRWDAASCAWRCTAQFDQHREAITYGSLESALVALDDEDLRLRVERRGRRAS